MKVQSLLYATALLSLSVFASCKKNSDDTSPSSNNLAPGKAAISFNTGSDFSGSTTFNPASPVQASAIRQASGSGYDNITLTVNDVNTTNFSTRNAQFIILLQSGSSTSAGTLRANFSNTASDPIFPVLVISSTNGTAAGDSYASESGAVEITKLSSTEIEGTFSGKFVNEDKGTSITLSNGKFAGKFK